MALCRFFYFLLLPAICMQMQAGAQYTAFEKTRLTVSEGLPQSYVSGIVQDKQGFIWISTRDGLARYDGRQFRVFRHRPGDTTSLSGNVITSLVIDRQQQLWIQYESGTIDILDLETENILHFTEDPVYKKILNRSRSIKTIIEDDLNRYWLIAENGLFIVDLPAHRLEFYSHAQLGIRNNPITGIGRYQQHVMLVCDTSIIIMNLQRKIVDNWPHQFSDPHLQDPTRPWKNNSPVIRPNGYIVIIYLNRLILFNPSQKKTRQWQFPTPDFYLFPPRVQDNRGNIIFGSAADIYMLTADDELKLWKERSAGSPERNTSLLLDRSGVLWLGTNGYFLRQFDLRLPRMPRLAYQENFTADILKKHLHVPETDLAKSPVWKVNTYFFRWLAGSDGRIWLSRAGAETLPWPELCYYKDGRIITERWQYEPATQPRPSRISAFAFSSSGRLWAVDHFLRLIRFDTLAHTATVVAQAGSNYINKPHTVNSLIIDDENTCWISTSFGLIRYDIATGRTDEFRDILSLSELTVIANDPVDKNILWIGTLGDGLISMDKRTYKFRIYTTYDGLPNNTIYAILRENNKLWCSSNKGIFSFEPATGTIRSYTTLDGLPVDEFNRFYFFRLPDGQLAFGGTQGYTVFDPSVTGYDDFEPPVLLTDIRINNKDADYGSPGALLPRAINSLDTLSLSYRQNFLTFEFAAPEYNIPEKLRYRYIMEGLDAQWIEAGTNNIATYTSLPPGHYIFRVNATNTAGKWSRSVKSIHVIITPPFWRNWWFITAGILLAAGLLLLVMRARVNKIRRQEQQKHLFEKEVSGLQAQALLAQMNPHFIFNCLNSIKALIQENRKEKAITYLTTFSKLVRNKLGSTQQEISLYSEIQTCRLYAQMEALRFGDRITYEFIIDDSIDPYSVKMPPLILQPLIENAAWHGILPASGKGWIRVSVQKNGDYLHCSVEDNGIGREQARLNKSANGLSYESRGMKLIADRLRLYNQQGDTGNMQVIDKTNENGQPAGTLVILKIKLNHD
ncbi:MAG: histidine kinase [Chitinophagaceae bacterium]